MAAKATLTQADVNLLKKTFATKKDLAGFATRSDLAVLPSKEDVKKIVVEAINDVVIPGMDYMAEGIKNELGAKIDSLERKFNSQQSRLDRHSQKIENLEIIHPQGRHITANN